MPFTALLVQQPAEMRYGVVVAPSLHADLADRLAEFLRAHPGAVVGTCASHPQWIAVRDTSRPSCPYCEADHLAAIDRGEVVRRVFVEA